MQSNKTRKIIPTSSISCEADCSVKSTHSSSNLQTACPQTALSFQRGTNIHNLHNRKNNRPSCGTPGLSKLLGDKKKTRHKKRLFSFQSCEKTKAPLSSVARKYTRTTHSLSFHHSISSNVVFMVGDIIRWTDSLPWTGWPFSIPNISHIAHVLQKRVAMP